MSKKKGFTPHTIRFQALLLASIVTIGIVWLISVVGSSVTTPQIPGWYATLIKPPLTPPNQIFGPAWTILYVLMAVSALLVWREGWKKPAVERALFLFVVQLFFNLLWSAFFFGMQNPLLALFDIILLWSAIVFTIMLFWHISRPAAWLLVPYLAWVSFATYLNIGIVLLNR